MIFADLVAADSVFLDANTFIYHFGPDPNLGATCSQLLQRIENQELTGFTSVHVDEVSKSRMQILDVPIGLLQSATSICWQTGLLINDALIVGLMQQHGLARLASHDADFDQVSGLTRYGPV